MADLLKVAQSSDNKIHRVLALRGYVRLIGLASGRPAKETIGMYKEAMSLAPDATEKKMVLSGLANVKSLGAMEMAVEYLEDKSLQQEAEFAVVKIAGVIGGSHPQQSKDVLKKVIQISKNDSLRQQAQEAINQIERPKTTPTVRNFLIRPLRRRTLLMSMWSGTLCRSVPTRTDPGLWNWTRR
jgi:hypothetical protein